MRSVGSAFCPPPPPRITPSHHELRQPLAQCVAVGEVPDLEQSHCLGRCCLRVTAQQPGHLQGGGRLCMSSLSRLTRMLTMLYLHMSAHRSDTNGKSRANSEDRAQCNPQCTSEAASHPTEGAASRAPLSPYVILAWPARLQPDTHSSHTMHSVCMAQLSPGLHGPPRGPRSAAGTRAPPRSRP